METIREGIPDSGHPPYGQILIKERMEPVMSDDIEASCIRKRGDNFKPHERIEGLGGMHNGQRWYMLEEDIIAELERPAASRRWAFYISVGGQTAWVVVATHDGRKYLKAQADKFSPDTLLALAECPSR